jgi:hypothetical protein
MGGQFLAPAVLNPGEKDPRNPLYRRLVDPGVSFDAMESKQNPSPSRESKPGRPVSGLVTILIELGGTIAYTV